MIWILYKISHSLSLLGVVCVKFIWNMLEKHVIYVKTVWNDSLYDSVAVWIWLKIMWNFGIILCMFENVWIIFRILCKNMWILPTVFKNVWNYVNTIIRKVFERNKISHSMWKCVNLCDYFSIRKVCETIKYVNVVCNLEYRKLWFTQFHIKYEWKIIIIQLLLLVDMTQ